MNELQTDSSRRQFLKISFFAGAGLILGGNLNACVPKETPDADELVENLNPHFKAYNPSTGGLVEARGVVNSVAEIENKAVFKLFNRKGGKFLYLNPLAIKSSYFGEHPAEKTLRVALQAKLDIPSSLEFKLKNPEVRDSLCMTVGGSVISEVLADGSVTVIIKDIPPNYLPPNSEYLPPKFFRITPNRLNKILLKKTGFMFDLPKGSLYEKAKLIFGAKTGLSLYSSHFRAEMLKKAGTPLESTDLMAGMLARLGDDIYFSTMDRYPTSTFGRLYKLDAEENLTKVHQGPGRLLFAMFNPRDTNKLLLSGEGYKEDNFRFQSLFELDLTTGKEEVIEFPGNSRSGKPELYGAGGMYDNNGNIILLRYGFTDEGGGLWWLNTTDCEDKKYLLPWDHMLGWSVLDQLSGKLVITAKEVEDNFSMTVNEATVTGLGAETTITKKRRIAKLTGWNPQVASFQKVEGGFKIQVQTPYSFEGYISNMPQAIYEVEL